jgi:hypothetical protein
MYSKTASSNMQYQEQALSAWSSLESDCGSASKEILCLLWNLKVQCGDHNQSLPWAIWIHLAHSNLISLGTILIFILSFSPTPTKLYCPYRLPSQSSVHISHIPIHVTCYIHFLDLIIPIMLWNVQIIKLFIMQFSLASCHSSQLSYTLTSNFDPSTLRGESSN